MSEELRESAEIEQKWNQHFTDAIRYIRQSLNQGDILKASVNQVRQILDCDRVLVYRLNQDSYGIVVAESVAAAWIRVQDLVIEDPCLAARYLDQYRQGRVQAWSNIYESGLQTRDVNQLERIEVKANLVAPIIKEGKLFGLLVAHQCSGFREWQQPEILWIAQIAMQIGFALDQAQLLTDSVQLQQELANEAQLAKSFTDTTRYLRESLTQEAIFNVTVEQVRQVLECDRVVVYSLSPDSNLEIIAESVAPRWTRALGLRINDPCFEPNRRKKYLNGRVRVWNNIREAGLSPCYIEQLEKLQVKANLVSPIINQGELFGLLIAHQCSQTRNWQPSEIRWSAQIAMQVGFALEKVQLLQQLDQSTKVGDGMSPQQEPAETLKHQLVEVLAQNGKGYQTVSYAAIRQFETTNRVRHQIQKVADSCSTITFNAQQIKLQKQQNDLAAQITQETLEDAISSISNIHPTLHNVTMGFDNLSHSCHKLTETVNRIRDLSKQIVQHSMSITRAVNFGQIKRDRQNSLIELSDSIFSLMQELLEATVKFELLFANIPTEIREKTIALKSGNQQLINGVSQLPTVRQKLEQVMALNYKTGNLMENIAQSLENQIASSTLTKNTTQELVAIAEQISEQSMAITQSFGQLVSLIQKLPDQ